MDTTYRDRSGNVITHEEWADLLTDEVYRLVRDSVSTTEGQGRRFVEPGEPMRVVTEWTPDIQRPFTVRTFCHERCLTASTWADEDAALGEHEALERWGLFIAASA